MTHRVSGRLWLWLGLAALVASFELAPFIDSLRPGPREGMDFFQEWSSAMNWKNGFPVYMDLDIAAERYLGRERVAGEVWLFTKNAHPPPAVLLALPFVGLSYPDAMLAWNLISLVALLASLWLILRQFEIRVRPWMLFALVAIGLAANPLRQQVNHGQLNLVLLVLIVGAWSAHRRERPALAGWLIGIAAAVKIFPGFLILFFALRTRWRSILSAVVASAAVFTLSWLVLGAEAWRTYVYEVAPTVSGFDNLWVNASLAGFWSKWFADGVGTASSVVGPPAIDPLWRAPAFAAAGSILTTLLVLVIWVRATFKLADDHAFSMSMVVMLLLSPVTWDHYFLLLLLPIVDLWRRFPEPHVERSVLIVVIIVLGLPPLLFANALTGAGPFLALVGVSVQFLALVALLFVSARPGSPLERRHATTVGV